jgi:thymidylate synthase (FAD)
MRSSNGNIPTKLSVLDRGYVQLVDWMGDDLSVVNAARVSFMKASNYFTDKDQGLLNYCVGHGHTSVLRHCCVELEYYAPLMVARQIWKYVVGGDHTVLGWNESSRRYVTEEPEFHVPDPGEWRSAPASKKQGSGDPINRKDGMALTRSLVEFQAMSEKMFNAAIDAGVAVEQARLFLPAYGLYIRWRWSTSLQGILHMLDERLDEHAQKETRDYAVATQSLVEQLFPRVFAAIRATSDGPRPTAGSTQT